MIDHNASENSTPRAAAKPMQIVSGIAVSPGLAIAEALVLGNDGPRVVRRFIPRDSVELEIDRLEQALASVDEQLEQQRVTVAQHLGEQYGAIFSAHQQMLRDSRLRGEIQEFVRGRHYSPEYSVSRTLRRYAKMFQELEGSMLAERAHDLLDLEKRLVQQLTGQLRHDLSNLPHNVVVLVHDLTPSETAHLDREHVLGFVTEIGGKGGHTAIVAQALEIPAIVGTGPFLGDAASGELVIVDGDRGQLILHPDEATLARYRHEVKRQEKAEAELKSLHELPAETADGVRVHLSANIEFPHEVEACWQRGADGIGLYRTEFLYLAGDTDPCEEDHFAAYQRVGQAMAGRPVVIRTLDLGADKLGRRGRPTHERNPFLGLRSIRLSLREPEQFRVQLRAALRASVSGNLKLMFPLITNLAELREAKRLLREVMGDLDRAGIAYNPAIEVGMMVEVPSAVVMLDRFAAEVDFFSIGTNDLIQYALAVDRSNGDVSDLYRASDPAVLRLIHSTLEIAEKAGVPVSMCGQMCGDPRYTALLLGLGLRSMSVPPHALPEIKRIVRSVTLPHCRRVAERAMTLDHSEEIDNYLKEEHERVAAESATR